MQYMILWGVIFVLAVIAELASLQLVSIWFAVGAVCAFAAAFFGMGFTGQFGLFVAVSVVLLIATRPLLKKLRVKQAPPMNADRDIGDTAVVIEEVNPALGTGRARTNGIDWIAVSEDGSVIPKETVVLITAIEGAKLIVRYKRELQQAQ
ncbi:MAG: NfeD family protein [Oscillospiraceae bacterium]|nr:NfeD family protein [Oscillospiraceae bacterium]